MEHTNPEKDKDTTWSKINEKNIMTLKAEYERVEVLKFERNSFEIGSREYRMLHQKHLADLFALQRFRNVRYYMSVPLEKIRFQ